MTTPASAPGDFPVRTIGDDDWAGFFEVDGLAFGGTAPDELIEVEREIFEAGRSIGAFDGATPVGIATAYSFDVSVPGAVLPAAGISAVGVLPTHRRRGVLRALMTHQLHDIHERGREPLAILWASEPPIYGRFGYGLASRAYALDVLRSPNALRADVPTDPTLRLRLVPADDWKITADVYARVAAQRPGMLARDERWWRKAARDLPSMREGARRCGAWSRRTTPAFAATRDMRPSRTGPPVGRRAPSMCARWLLSTHPLAHCSTASCSTRT